MPTQDAFCAGSLDAEAGQNLVRNKVLVKLWRFQLNGSGLGSDLESWTRHSSELSLLCTVVASGSKFQLHIRRS